MFDAHRRARSFALALIAISTLAPVSQGAADSTAKAAASSQCAGTAARGASASRKRLTDGFETGNTDAWTRSRGSAHASTQARFKGRYGLLAPGGEEPSSVVRRVEMGARVVLSLCWRVTRSAPVTIARLTASGGTVTFRRDRRLALRVKGARTHVRQRTGLRPGRWVAVRVETDAPARTVRMSVNGRVESIARTNLSPETSIEVGQLGGGGLAPPVAVDGVSVSSGPSAGASTPPTGEGPPASPVTPADDPLRPFAPTSIWNKPLTASPALAADSNDLVNELVRQTLAYDPWLNTASYSTPVYRVPAGQPTVRVKLDTYGPDLQQTWTAVPIPATAAPSAGSDQHMVVWQPSTDRMWEFWLAKKMDDGWHARWGGTIDDVSKDPGYFTHRGATTNWGATATGLPLHGGLITLEDLTRGYIDHALALAVVEAKPGATVWPAQRNDGFAWTRGIHAIPEGTRFRLDPSVDVDSLKASPFVKMLARAAQDYGIVVRDKSGSVSLYGEDPTPTGSNPWSSVWQGGWPNKVLRSQFPWSQLQVVDPSVR
jgi:hypothetical protein